MTKVLLVDDEIEIIEGRSRIIRNLGYDCLTAQNGNEAIKIIKKDSPDIILTDIKMPDGDGIAVLKVVKKVDPDIPVIVFTGHGSIDSAIEAMKLGAFDYIQKPVTKDMIQVILKKAIDFRKLKEENLLLKKQFKQKYQLDHIVYKSLVMSDVAKRVTKAAGCEANVLIYGETGTGKELIARNIHIKSNRKDKPFIPIDCSSLPPNLMESELFGFEKGAFTGAIKTKPGLIEIADGGTLFLDEITEMDYSLQSKLLRIIQDNQFRHVGGTKLINVDIRIISATNLNPENAIKEKKLRRDLYFRLNVIKIYMPPLRERKNDIPVLVKNFIDEFNPYIKDEIKGVSKEAMSCLMKYDWPGNVRELKNSIEHAMSLAEQDTISLEDLPEEIKEFDNSLLEDTFQGLNFQEAKEKCLNQFYKKYIGYLLKKYDGSITKIAHECGLSRWTIYRILESIKS